MHHINYFNLDDIFDKDSEEYKFFSAVEYLLIHDEINVTINGLESQYLYLVKDEETRKLVIDTVNAIKKYNEPSSNHKHKKNYFRSKKYKLHYEKPL